MIIKQSYALYVPISVECVTTTLSVDCMVFTSMVDNVSSGTGNQVSFPSAQINVLPESSSLKLSLSISVPSASVKTVMFFSSTTPSFLFARVLEY